MNRRLNFAYKHGWTQSRTMRLPCCTEQVFLNSTARSTRYVRWTTMQRRQMPASAPASGVNLCSEKWGHNTQTFGGGQDGGLRSGEIPLIAKDTTRPAAELLLLLASPRTELVVEWYSIFLHNSGKHCIGVPQPKFWGRVPLSFSFMPMPHTIHLHTHSLTYSLIN